MDEPEEVVKVAICVDDQLLYFLPLKKRLKHITIEFTGKRSVFDLVQSLGIPHTEIAGIRVNGQWVDFACIPSPDSSSDAADSPGSGTAKQDISVIELFSIENRALEKKNPLYTGKSSDQPPRFLCDVHLRKLARRLRLLGFDTWYDFRLDDPELAEISAREKLILLTRDRGLLMRGNVTLGMYVRSTDTEQQVEEILRRFVSLPLPEPFSRCLLCNGHLEPIHKESNAFETMLKPLVPPKVLTWAKEFHFCRFCRKAYWKGTHYKELLQKLETYRNHLI